MADLILSFMGPWRVTLAGREPDFGYDKVRALLAYLAVEAGRAHPRESLLALLWPELPEQAARNNLRQVLLTLRRALGDDHAAAQPFLLANRAAIQFNPAAGAELDVAAFTALLEACRVHAHRRPGSCKACAERRQRAVDLYRGPFLSEFSLPDSAAFEEWALLKREWLARQMLEALDWLAAYYERRGQFAQARQAVHRQLELEPWREAAHRSLMRLLLLTGERAAALAQYEKCRRLLEEELGVEPEAATTLLYEQLRDAGDEQPIAPTQLALPAARPHTLPPPATPFVGREQELAAIARQLDDPDCRLLTLSGPGGSGKTRLALQAAADYLDVFADGVYFVPLAGLPAAELLPATIGAALGLDLAAEDPATAVLHALRDKELLLLLDNYEHLLPATALPAAILREAPGVTLLVTSSARLHLQGEWLLEVGGLPVPGEGDPATGDAVQLFVQSARRARAGFALGAHNQDSVAHICRLLDGLPLALELAAAWVRLLSCAEIAAEIARGLDFLTSSLRDVPARQRSLTAVFEHSWRLLSPAEQVALRRLALFRGGFRRAAAEEVAGAALPLLAGLMDKSFVRRQANGRFQLHELLRHFAAAQLAAAEEEDATGRRFAAFYCALAETAEPQLTGGQQQTWLARLDEERANLRAALARALEHGDLHTAARLGGAIWRYWQLRGDLHEGRAWLARIRDAGRALPPDLRAPVLKGAGVLAWYQSDYDQAAPLFEASLALYRQLEDQEGIATLTNNLGVLALHQGRYAEAVQMLEQSLAQRRRLDDTWGMATCLNNLGAAAGRLGERQRAAAYYRESLALSRRLGNLVLTAMLLTNLGDVAAEEGDAAGAQALYEESLALREQLGEKVGLGQTRMRLARMAARQGRPAEACRSYDACLQLFAELGDREHLTACFEEVAGLAAAGAGPETAVRLWSAAAALREALALPLPPARAAELRPQQDAARALLPEARWHEAWSAGRALTLDEALALARAACR